MEQKVSVLIITYNRPEDLLELLMGFAGQEGLEACLEEILVLDNASTVSYQQVRNFISTHPSLPIQYIESGENLGVARGRNRLMQIARGDLLLVIDDDILLVAPDDIARIAASFNHPFFREHNTAVITFRVLYHELRQVQVTAFPHKKYEQYKDKPIFLTSYFTGCAHLLKREVLAQTGLYPEDFFYGMEEYDLSYRIIDAGYSLAYDGSVTLLHKESPLGRQPNARKLQMQWVNKSKVAWRYLPALYFLTTATGWSFEYLKKAGGNWAGYFQAWGKVLKIPFSVQRKKVGRHAMAYLKKVEARLWY